MKLMKIASLNDTPHHQIVKRGFDGQLFMSRVFHFLNIFVSIIIIIIRNNLILFYFFKWLLFWRVLCYVFFSI